MTMFWGYCECEQKTAHLALFAHAILTAKILNDFYIGGVRLDVYVVREGGWRVFWTLKRASVALESVS